MTQPPLAPPGYRDVSIPLEQVTTRAALWMIPLTLAPLIPYWLLYGFAPFWDRLLAEFNWLLFLLAMIAGIFLHEAVHAVGWKLASGLPWSAFSFGIDRKTGSPYCHASAPMRASAYRLGALLPSIVTGVVPVIAGTLRADPVLTLSGAVLISAAVGDFFVVWVLRAISGDALVLDHPTQAGGFVKDAG